MVNSIHLGQPPGGSLGVGGVVVGQNQQQINLVNLLENGQWGQALLNLASPPLNVAAPLNLPGITANDIDSFLPGISRLMVIQYVVEAMPNQ
ncbi:MAG: hypothetical protein LBF49_00290 [Puniceicoccales bacterium]|jgi:hypothetical protein|nr:hypothetical protein [Puniceicoccales bacterium]